MAFQSSTYSFCPPDVAVPSFAVSVAGRMLDGREEIVFSVARSWYSAGP